MGSNGTRSRYTGILVEHEDIELWTEETTVRSNGAHVGRAVPTEASRLSLRTLHRDRDDALDYDQVTIATQRGGLPDGTGQHQAATFRFRRGGSGDWYGWDPCYLPVGVQPIAQEYENIGGLTRQEFSSPTLAEGLDGTLFLAYLETRDDGNYARLLVRSLGADDAEWGNPVVIDSDTSSSAAGDAYESACPRIVCLPDGRLLVFIYWFGRTGSEDAQVRSYTSDDDGATWSLVGDRLLPDDIDVSTLTLRDLHVAQRNGEIVLFAELAKSSGDTLPVLRQYLSVDGGCSFALVDDSYLLADDVPARLAVCSSQLGFHLAYSTTAAATTRVYHAMIASGAQSFRSARSVEVDEDLDWASRGGSTPYDVAAGALALAADERGGLWLYTQTPSTGTDRAYRSVDGGRNWVRCGDGQSKLCVGNAEIKLTRMQAAWHGSRMAIAYTLRASGSLSAAADVAGSVGVLWFGGHTTVEQVSRELGRVATMDRIHQLYGWVAWDVPSASVWTQTVSPSTLEIGSTADGPGWLCVADTVGATHYRWARTAAMASSTTGWQGRFVWQTDESRAAAASAQQLLQWEFAATSGAARYGFRITADDGHVWVHETTGASSYTELVEYEIDVTPGLEVRWAVSSGGYLRVWVRELSYGPLRAWTEILQATALGDVVVSVTSDRYWWGVLPDANQIGRWREHEVGLNGNDLVEQGNPDDLVGREYSTVGAPVVDGIVLRADAGPTYPGETWTIDTAYRYGVENILLDDSTAMWRGPYGTDNVIAVRWDDDNAWMPTNILGIAFLGTNVGPVQVELYDADLAAWTDLGLIDTSIQLGTTKVRGRTARPDDTTTLHVRQAEFDGAWFSIDPADETPAVRISRTHQGQWKGTGGSSTVRESVLELEAAPDGITFGADLPSSAILPFEQVLLVSLRSGRYKGLRLTLHHDPGTSYVPTDQDWVIIRLKVGPVHLVPDESDWQRTQRIQPTTQRFEARDGTRTTARWGAPRRVLTMSWVAGIDSTKAQDGSDPAYHRLDASGEALGHTGTSPYLLAGLIEQLSGDHRPIVLLPAMEAFSSRVEVLNRRHQMLHGRIVSSPSLETAQGEEDVDEVIRVQQLTVEGEL